MFRLTFRRAAVLVLVASLGVFSAPYAEAARAGNGKGNLIHAGLSLRTFVYNAIDFLRSLSATKDDPPPPNNPGNDPGNDPPPSSGNREGSAGNPLGHPPGHP